MNTLLFFDDQRLLNKTNMKRVYGTPELIESSIFIDKSAHTSAGLPSVWKDDSGIYHMFYQGWLQGKDEFSIVTLAACSVDCVHWEPRNTAVEAGIENPVCENQLLPLFDGEIATVFIDEFAPKKERLKALVATYLRDEVRVENIIYTSGDGIHWKLDEGVSWNKRGAEPGAGCFWCDVTKSYIITARPGWGTRRICVSETKDFKTFTPSELIIQADSIDESLSETYGMPSFKYKEWYIGLLWIYHTPKINETKYLGGKVDCQLAYSLNGKHWQRSLRTPFIGNGSTDSPMYGMVFPSYMTVQDNGDILVTSSATVREHGYFHLSGASIITHKLREDGFICLESCGGEGKIFTRQILIQGEIFINADCPYGQITCAVYDDEYKLIYGYSHNDCNLICGDNASFSIDYKNGNKISDLIGKVVCLEISVTAGKIYSIKGEYVHLMNQEATRYIKHGVLPNINGF